MLQSGVQVTCLTCGSARFLGDLEKCIKVDDVAKASREIRSFDQVQRFQRILQPMLQDGQTIRGLGTELHLDKTHEGLARPPEAFSGCVGDVSTTCFTRAVSRSKRVRESSCHI